MKYSLLAILISLSGITRLQASEISNNTLLSKQNSPADSIRIRRARADELLAKLPATDPWELRPDGSALENLAFTAELLRWEKKIK